MQLQLIFLVMHPKEDVDNANLVYCPIVVRENYSVLIVRLYDVTKNV